MRDLDLTTVTGVSNLDIVHCPLPKFAGVLDTFIVHAKVTVVAAGGFEKPLCYSCAISKCFAELLSNNFQYLFPQPLCNHSAMFYNDCTMIVQLLYNCCRTVFY